MKQAKVNTLRTQQAIARFGKSARHPLCLAGLNLWQLRAELIEQMKDEISFEKVLNSAKLLQEEAQFSIRQLREERKEKELNLWNAQLRKIDEHLVKVQACYEAKVGLRLFHQELHQLAASRFNRERAIVARTKDVKALRALQRVRQQWRANPGGKGVRLRAGDQRELEILNMHRDKVINAAWAKGGATAGYSEAAFGGDRLLADEVWQGRFTVKEIYSRLLAAYGRRVAGDKDGKEIRRTLRKLGIRPAEDQRGRKWKPPAVRSPRPAHPAVEITGTDRLEAVEAEVEKEKGGKTVKHEESLSWKMRNRQELAWARRVIKSMEREIAKLELVRGGNRGKFVY